MSNILFYRRTSNLKNVRSCEERMRGQTTKTKPLENYYQIFIDNITTKRPKRPKLDEMIDSNSHYITDGVLVEVRTMYELSWSFRDLKTQVDRILEKGGSIYFIDTKMRIDNKTEEGKKNYNIINMFSQFQSECDKKRHTEGIQLGKEKGHYKGRVERPLPKNWKTSVEMWERKEITGVQCMKRVKMKSSTFYRRYNQWKKEQENKVSQN